MQRISLSILLLIFSCEKTVEPEDCAGYFDFKQSDLQAPYYFLDVKIENISIEEEDWVVAFNGDICVGARKGWGNTELCGGGICEVMAMGNSGQDETIGYCNPGDIPTFKIYDVSEGIIYNTTTTDTIPSWEYNNSSIIDSTLMATDIYVSNCQ